MDEWKVLGLAVAVVQNGEDAFVGPHGLRDVEAGLKVTTDTQFQLMSASKSFTATGLALLVDERRMVWKKPVREYIPEFRLHDPVASDRVTVRDLLCHHSGLPRHNQPILAPTDTILKAYKKDKGDWGVYRGRFLQLVEERKIEQRLEPQMLESPCLLCSEATPHHCHRRLVCEYLNDQWNGVLSVKHL